MHPLSGHEPVALCQPYPIAADQCLHQVLQRGFEVFSRAQVGNERQVFLHGDFFAVLIFRKNGDDVPGVFLDFYAGPAEARFDFGAFAAGDMAGAVN